MLMTMHFDKSQVPSIIKYTEPGSSGNFSKILPIMAGYRRYDVMVVGAAGGRSGNVVSNSGLKGTAYGSGSGAGGCLQAWGRLQDLGDLTPYSVGKAGTHGTNKTGNNVQANSGTDGTHSVFGAYTGRAGGGAIGSSVNSSTSFFQYNLGRGGHGGSNTPLHGDGGLGGGDRAGGVEVDPPVDGLWAYDPGPDPITGGVIGGGGGGGGGCGRIQEGTGSITHVAAQAGSDGNFGNANVMCEGGAVNASRGGDGGGSNIKPIIGTDEIYGSYVPNSTPDGVVVIKLS
jgi:hypothetical protein